LKLAPPSRSIAITSWPPEPVLFVLTGERVHNEKSTSARRLTLSLGNQNLQFAKGRVTPSGTPLKFRTE
jgi:hypothetical protein